jgi:hypothetical protein
MIKVDASRVCFGYIQIDARNRHFEWGFRQFSQKRPMNRGHKLVGFIQNWALKDPFQDLLRCFSLARMLS